MQQRHRSWNPHTLNGDASSTHIAERNWACSKICVVFLYRRRTVVSGSRLLCTTSYCSSSCTTALIRKSCFIIPSAVATESGSDSNILGSFRFWGPYMANFSQFVCSVRRTIFVNALLAYLRYRQVTYGSVLSTTAVLCNISAASYFFSPTGLVTSAKVLACDLRAKPSFFHENTSSTFRAELEMR